MNRARAATKNIPTNILSAEIRPENSPPDVTHRGNPMVDAP